MSKQDRIVEALEALRHMDVVLQTTNRLSGLLDSTVIAQRAAHEIQRTLGVPLASVGIRESADVIAMRGTAGALTQDYGRSRVPAGQGIGGKVLLVKRPISVFDYERDPEITKEFVDLVSRREGVHGMAGVPLEYEGETVGVLYAGIRNLGFIGDRALSIMMAMAPSLGVQIGTAGISQKMARIGIEKERQRIAQDLHDSVGQMLFGIGVATRKLQERIPAEAADLLTELKTIEVQTSQAASFLRDALRALAPSSSGDAFPAAASMDAEAFAARSGIATDCIVLGDPVELRPETEAALLAVVREGLHNVEKHASAKSVILTLRWYTGNAEVIIQDDGRGLPSDFDLDPVPREGKRWGLASLRQKVERLGGRIQLINNEDGGVTLRASIPMEGGARGE